MNFDSSVFHGISTILSLKVFDMCSFLSKTSDFHTRCMEKVEACVEQRLHPVSLSWAGHREELCEGVARVDEGKKWLHRPGDTVSPDEARPAQYVSGQGQGHGPRPGAVGGGKSASPLCRNCSPVNSHGMKRSCSWKEKVLFYHIG